MPVVNNSSALNSGFSWNGIEANSNPVVVTFSFPTSAPGYLNGVDGFTAATVESFRAFDAAQQAQARTALGEFAAAGNIQFIEVAAGQGDINFQIVDLSTSTYENEGGLAFLPSGDRRTVPSFNGQTIDYFSSGLDVGGDVFMNAGGIDGGALNYGTLLHQIGRAIGLKRPTEITDSGRDVHDEILSSDDFSRTVMASAGNGLPEGDVHLTALDRTAVQNRYGYGAGGVQTGDASGSNQRFSWSWDADTQTLTQTISRNADLQVRGSSVNDIIGPQDRFAGRMVMAGREGDDRLTVSNFDDVLDGGTGADIMAGGRGNDTYYVENIGDQVIEERLNIGMNYFDTVISTIDYTLTDNVEVLRLVGANLTGQGNSIANTLYADVNYASTLIGAQGNDTYYIYKASDRILEFAAEGNDTVVSTVSFEVGGLSIEAVQLAGDADIDATGSAQANTLTGNGGRNVLTGLAGDDILDGKGGVDLMVGGTGNDTYYVDNSADRVIETQGAAQGRDTVYASATFDLTGQFVEVLRLTGTADIDAYGNSQVNWLYGNDGDNILDGRGGIDQMAGGRGDDIYYVDHADEWVSEQAGSYYGNDTVRATVSYDLTGKYVENLTLLGSDDLNAYGNSLSNVLIGNDGDNILNGRAGRDTMTGGSGDDTYYVDNPFDVVIETQGAAQGNDTIYSSISYSLFSTFVETLALTGGDDIDATGNAQANRLIGNAGDNVLTGRGGADTFVFNGAFGRDTVTDFDTNADLIQFGSGSFADYSQVMDRAAQVGDDVVISFDPENTLTLQGVMLGTLEPDHFLFA